METAIAATTLTARTVGFPLPSPGVPETPQFRPLYPFFFSFDTFPRSSNLVNRCCFYPPKQSPLSTRESTPPVFQHHLRRYQITPILEVAAQATERQEPRQQWRGNQTHEHNPSVRTLAVRRSQNYLGSIRKVSF